MFVPLDRCIAHRCNIRLLPAFWYSSGASEKPVIQVIIVELASGDVSARDAPTGEPVALDKGALWVNLAVLGWRVVWLESKA